MNVLFDTNLDPEYPYDIDLSTLEIKIKKPKEDIGGEGFPSCMRIEVEGSVCYTRNDGYSSIMKKNLTHSVFGYLNKNCDTTPEFNINLHKVYFYFRSFFADFPTIKKKETSKNQF